MKTLQDFIKEFVLADNYSFSKRNKPDWITDESIRSMYTGTTGPHASPDPVECWTLYNLSLLSKRNILEIGSWKGRSSCFLAKGIQDSGDVSTRRLYCLDWFKGDDTGGANPNKSAMEESLAKFKLTDIVTIYDEDMLEFDFESKVKDIDLVFYDSDHRTEPTIKVLSKLHSILNTGCIVAIHDASWGMTVNAIRGLSDKYEHIKTLPVWEGFGVLIKK